MLTQCGWGSTHTHPHPWDDIDTRQMRQPLSKQKMFIGCSCFFFFCMSEGAGSGETISLAPPLLSAAGDTKQEQSSCSIERNKVCRIFPQTHQCSNMTVVTLKNYLLSKVGMKPGYHPMS